MEIVQPIDESHREFVGSLAKGLSVIRVFGKDTPELSVTEVARATETTRAAARRFLLTLHALGYVQSDGKLYRLTPKTLELGFSFLSSHSWLSVASPLLDRLKVELGESVSVTVLEGAEVVYLARFPADRVMTLSMEVGSRRPAWCTAMGRALLGELPEAEARRVLAASALKAYTKDTVTDPDALIEEFRKARRQGYALVEEELEDGLVAVSVPLRDARGQAVAAANVCGHSSHLSITDLEKRCLPALQECVARISRSLV